MSTAIPPSPAAQPIAHLLCWLPPGVNVKPGDVLLDDAAAAKFVGMSARTLQRHRQAGTGPAFVRLGVRRLAYRVTDLRAWIEGRRVGGGNA